LKLEDRRRWRWFASSHVREMVDVSRRWLDVQKKGVMVVVCWDCCVRKNLTTVALPLVEVDRRFQGWPKVLYGDGRRNRSPTMAGMSCEVVLRGCRRSSPKERKRCGDDEFSVDELRRRR
jgi:hypothetical protein